MNRHILIILEGCDNSGKTTLAQNIEKVTNASTYKFTRTPKDDTDLSFEKLKTHYTTFVETISQTKCYYHIADRLHLSQMVYSIKRGRDMLTDPWFQQFEREFVMPLQHILVLCDPPQDVVESRMKVRGDDYIKIQEIPLIMQRYKLAFEKSILDKMIVDTSKNPFGCAMDVIDAANKWKPRVRQW